MPKQEKERENWIEYFQAEWSMDYFVMKHWMALEILAFAADKTSTYCKTHTEVKSSR